MKIKNLKVTASALALGGILLYARSLDHSIEGLKKSFSSINAHLDSLEACSTVTVSLEPIGLDHEPPQIEVKKLEKKKTVEEEIEELLEESHKYRKIAEYVSEMAEEDIEIFQKEILDYYRVTAKNNTFRFNPNNLQEAERRIKEYAERMYSEENETFAPEYYIDNMEEDLLVVREMSRYQEDHPEKAGRFYSGCFYRAEKIKEKSKDHSIY